MPRKRKMNPHVQASTTVLANLGFTAEQAKLISSSQASREQPASVPEIVVKASEDGKSAEILLYEFIGFDWWTGEGMTAKRFNDEIEALGDVDMINLRVNSPGGEVFDAFAIYTILTRTSARIEVDIDGLAASAASFLIMAGDEIRCAKAGMMMIHDALYCVCGNAQEMLDAAALMEKLDGQIASLYATRTGKSVDHFKALMDEETWFTAEEALAEGLVDSVVDEDVPTNDASPKGSERKFTREQVSARLMEIESQTCI